NGSGFEILALCVRQLEFGRKRQPELEALEPLRVSGTQFLAVPNTAAGAHPLDATIADGAGVARAVVKARVAVGEHGHGGYPGVWMEVAGDRDGFRECEDIM